MDSSEIKGILLEAFRLINKRIEDVIYLQPPDFSKEEFIEILNKIKRRVVRECYCQNDVNIFITFIKDTTLSSKTFTEIWINFTDILLPNWPIDLNITFFSYFLEAAQKYYYTLEDELLKLSTTLHLEKFARSFY